MARSSRYRDRVCVAYPLCIQADEADCACQQVSLKRVLMEQLMDLKRMHDIMTKAVKLATRDHDAEEVEILKQGYDLFTKIIVADHMRDEQVAQNVTDMQSLSLNQLDALKKMLQNPSTSTADPSGASPKAYVQGAQARVSELEEQLRLMKVKLAESDKNLADVKLQLADKDRNISELMQHIADLTTALGAKEDLPKPPMSDDPEALKLIEQIKETLLRKVLEVPLDHITEGTAAESANTSVGLIFEQKGGKTLIVNTLVGSPAFGCQKLHAGDEVRVHG